MLPAVVQVGRPPVDTRDARLVGWRDTGAHPVSLSLLFLSLPLCLTRWQQDTLLPTQCPSLLYLSLPLCPSLLYDILPLCIPLSCICSSRPVSLLV